MLYSLLYQPFTDFRVLRTTNTVWTPITTAALRDLEIPRFPTNIVAIQQNGDTLGVRERRRVCAGYCSTGIFHNL